MKARLDYVSNSSSSSFMIVGSAFDDDEVLKAWKRLHPDNEASEEDEDGIWETAEKLAYELGLTMHRGISNYYDMWVIGLEFSSMKDDETTKQFKDRIKDALSKAFDDVEVVPCTDGGYDG